MKYDTQMIKKIGLFERVTGALVKDAFYYRERLCFVVEPGEMGKALGKNKQNLKKLMGMFKEKLKIVEYDPELQKFITNFLNPLQIQNMTVDDGIIVIEGGDEKTNGLIIGKNARNLRRLEEIVNHYFDVKEIKVR